jgi:hypothetical protein
MDIVIDLVAFLLIAVALSPLLLLALYVLADRLNIPWAERVLGAMAGMLRFQWLLGGLLSLVLGLALVAAGIWLAMQFETLIPRVAGVLMVPFGLWRTWRGALMLKP